MSAQHGAFFLSDHEEEGADYELRLLASFGYTRRKQVANRFRPGDGLVGQAALEKKPILITDPPEDYVQIASGLGKAAPTNIIVIPVLFEEQVLAVIELASFTPFSEVILQFLDQLTETIGVVLSTIIANVRTEQLLQQSQSQSQELQEQSQALQSQQEELQATNEELQEKAEQLERQNRDIEIKNREIEMARSSLEEKAEQLALSSKYKSEFLANMSHELRTPLNSLLILSKVLASNEVGNLTAKQVDAASTIHNAGSDLLALINDILDLSKVEAGKMDVHAGRTELDVRARLRGALVQADRRGEGAPVRHRAGARRPGADQHRRAAPPAGAEEPALERVQVHREGLGRADDCARRRPTCSSRASCSPARRA